MRTARPLVGQGTADGVSDPPRSVGGEAITACVVEALDRFHQADVALLNQVNQRQAAAVVAPRDADHEPEICLHEAVLGQTLRVVGGLHALDVAAVGLGIRHHHALRIFFRRIVHHVTGGAVGVGHPDAIRIWQTNVARQRLGELRPLTKLVRVQLGTLLPIHLGQSAEFCDLSQFRTLFRVERRHVTLELLEHVFGSGHVGEQRCPVLDLCIFDGLRGLQLFIRTPSPDGWPSP